MTPETSPDKAEHVPPPPKVRRRHVFFIPGYDPNVPRRYRELYRREGAKQAAISGYRIAVSGRPRDQNYQWAIEAEIDGARTHTTMEFLTWEDIVRRSMDRSILSSLFVLLRTAWIYLTSGALIRLLRLRPQPMLAALYPLVIIAAQVTLAWIAARLTYWALSDIADGWPGLCAGSAAFVAVIART